MRNNDSYNYNIAESHSYSISSQTGSCQTSSTKAAIDVTNLQGPLGFPFNPNDRMVRSHITRKDDVLKSSVYWHRRPDNWREPSAPANFTMISAHTYWRSFLEGWVGGKGGP